MPVFEYKALTETGKPISGLLDAATPLEVRRRLRRRKIHPTEVKQLRKRHFCLRLPLFTNLPLRKSTLVNAPVTRQLATLLDAGIPVAEGLDVLIEQLGDKSLEAVFRDVRERITQGSTLADAMAFHPRYFNEVYVNMVRSGEASGSLSLVLERLADYIWRRNRLYRRISAALTYPAIMSVIGAGVIVFLITFVVPKIVTLLKEAHKALPTPTYILIGVSSFMRQFWWLLLAGGILVYVLMRLMMATEKGKLFLDTYKLRLPVVGELLRKSAVSRFAISLSALLKSGIPVLEALEIVKNVIGNVHILNTISKLQESIIAGKDIAEPLKKSRAFPPLVGYMIAVGERTGRLEDILGRISEAYDEEIELASQKFTALLEPILIVLMALVVGFIVISILLPILELGQIG